MLGLSPPWTKLPLKYTLLTYKKTADFICWLFILQFNWICLLILTGLCVCVCVCARMGLESLGFYIFDVISSANLDNISSSLDLDDFYYFPCLIAKARNSNIMLNRSMRVGTHVLFLTLEGNFFLFWWPR